MTHTQGPGETPDPRFTHHQHPHSTEPRAEVSGLGEAGLPEGWIKPDAGDELVQLTTSADRVDLFRGEPFDLGGTQVFTTVAFLTQAAMRVRARQNQDTLEQQNVRGSVEISLEAALRDPDSMLDMVRTTPLSAFHERVIATTGAIAEFEANFALYFKEGPHGLWRSLEFTQEEINASASRGASSRKARGESNEAISIFKVAAKAGQPWEHDQIANRIGKNPLYTNIYDYIIGIDTLVRDTQPGSQTSRARVKGSDMTRERLERLVASGRYAYEVEQVRSGSIKHRGDLTKLIGIEHKLTELWPKHLKKQLIDDPDGFSAGEQAADLPEELLDLEALKIALTARYSLRGASEKGRKAVAKRVAHEINAMTKLQDDMEAARGGAADTSILSLDIGTLSENQFKAAIQVAGTTWLVARQVDPANFAAFEYELLKDLKATLRGQGLLKPLGNDSGLAEGGSSELDAGVRTTMTATDFAGITALQRQEMALDPRSAGDQEKIIRNVKFFGAQAARQTDTEGRYGELSDRSREIAGSNHRAEEFPGAGRLFVYYGSFRREDGDMGVIEAIAALAGGYDHIETAGISPMRSAAVRAQLEKISKNPLHVYKPFDTIPDEYICETAHFVGKLPRWMEPEHILPIVIPNGLATVEQLVNKQLVEELQNSEADAQIRLIPTELVRFLRTDGKLHPEVGHNYPNWHWPEQTLAIFFNKSDGTPSDLFQFLYPKEAAVLMTATSNQQ